MAMSVTNRERLASGMTYWVTAIAMIGSLYASYLHYNAYPIASSAFAIGWLVAAACVIPLAILASLHPWALVLASGFLGYSAVALAGLKGEIFGAIFLAGFVALKGRKVLGFAAIIFVVIGLTTPLRQEPPVIERDSPVRGTSDLPPLIHIVLDEHGPADFSDAGFTTWANARTAHDDTRESLSHILRGYPSALKERGYELEVWQSDYFRFCRAHCLTYRTHAMDVIHDHPDRDRIAFLVFFEQLFPDFTPVTLWSLNGHRALELAVERSRTLRRGEALFLHAIIPHHPFVLDEQCDVLPVEEWKNRHSDAAEAAYDRQVRCVRSLIERLPEDAVVVIHGDHGNRLTDGKVADNDYAAHHTLFAIRNGNPAIREEPAMVRDLLFDFVESLPGETDGLTPPPQAP